MEFCGNAYCRSAFLSAINEDNDDENWIIAWVTLFLPRALWNSWQLWNPFRPEITFG